MSYTPTQWKAGDTVTSAKLNKMEQGIANVGGVNILVAHLINSTENEEDKTPVRAAGIVTPDTPDISGTLDVTLEEIENADFTIVKIRTDDEIGNTHIDSIYYDEVFNCYVLRTTFYSSPSGDNLVFFATNNDDYPTTSLPEEDASTDTDK